MNAAALTLYQALKKSAATYPRRPALTYAGETLTFTDVGTRVDRLARGLRHLGVGPGDKVAFLLPSCLDAPIVFFAPAALGAVIVPVNPVFRQKEIQHILEDSEASVVIAEPRPLGNDLQRILDNIRPSLPNLKHIILRGISAPSMLRLEDLPEDSDPLPERAVPPEALCALVYTSGTTGVPKAVMHSHKSMLAAASSGRSRFDVPRWRQLWSVVQLTREYGTRFIRYGTKPITSLSAAPLHSLVGYGAILYAMLYGYHIVIADRFHPARVLELVEKHRVNALGLTPTMLTALLESPDRKRRDLSSLLAIYVGAAPTPPDLIQRARDELHCPVLISFGTTEVGGSTMMGNLFDPVHLQAKSVGKLLPGIEAMIVDEQRREVPRGEVGELALRLDSPMLGYYKAPELTAASLDADGWYYTGDLATMDGRGYFRVVGRKKEMIIRGGQNIYPIEIENHLLAKAGIENVAVVGVPDSIAGERVWAFVLPKPGMQLTTTQVFNYCREELAPFKAPDQVRIVDSLPLTSNGKVQKFLLLQQVQREMDEKWNPAIST